MSGVIVFDAYGTLFDIHGAARIAAQRHPRLATVWPRVSDDWRRKQLEYAWLRTLAGDPATFWTVTEDALDWTLAAHHLADAPLRDELLSLYRRLPAYPEVALTLDRLGSRGWRRAILSNGNAAMLEDAVASAGIGGLLDAVLSVEDAGCFKPHPVAYALATAHFSCPPAEIVFVSANGWDVYGATRFGCRAVWVNRAAVPPDNLPASPIMTLPDLIHLPEVLP